MVTSVNNMNKRLDEINSLSRAAGLEVSTTLLLGKEKRVIDDLLNRLTEMQNKQTQMQAAFTVLSAKNKVASANMQVASAATEAGVGLLGGMGGAAYGEREFKGEIDAIKGDLRTKHAQLGGEDDAVALGDVDNNAVDRDQLKGQIDVLNDRLKVLRSRSDRSGQNYAQFFGQGIGKMVGSSMQTGAQTLSANAEIDAAIAGQAQSAQKSWSDLQERTLALLTSLRQIVGGVLDGQVAATRM